MGPAAGIQGVVRDEGIHDTSTIERLADAGIRTGFPERKQRGERRWKLNGGRKTAIAVYQNRARLGARKNERLRRRRGELLERTFARLGEHAPFCEYARLGKFARFGETGGHGRTRLRGRKNVQERCLMQAAAFDLGLVLRKLLGHGTPRALAATAERRFALMSSISGAPVIACGALDTLFR